MPVCQCLYKGVRAHLHVFFMKIYCTVSCAHASPGIAGRAQLPMAALSLIVMLWHAQDERAS